MMEKLHQLTLVPELFLYKAPQLSLSHTHKNTHTHTLTLSKCRQQNSSHSAFCPVRVTLQNIPTSGENGASLALTSVWRRQKDG